MKYINMKKYFAVILALFFILLPFFSISVYAINEDLFYYETCDGGICISSTRRGYIDYIPEEIDGEKVIKLGYRAFLACSDSENSITIPDTVTEIESECFLGISNSVGYSTYFISKNIQTIGEKAIGYYACMNYIDGCLVYDEIHKFDNEITICGYTDTVAETYANENGFTFIALDEETNTTVAGDVNADGFFTIADVILLQKWLLAVPDIELANWKAADFYEDDRLNTFDLCLMKRALVAS